MIVYMVKILDYFVDVIGSVASKFGSGGGVQRFLYLSPVNIF